MLEKIVISLFYLNEKVKLTSIYHDFFNEAEYNYKHFTKICNEVWREAYKYLNGKLGINWDWIVFYFNCTYEYG